MCFGGVPLERAPEGKGWNTTLKIEHTLVHFSKCPTLPLNLQEETFDWFLSFAQYKLQFQILVHGNRMSAADAVDGD